MDKKTSSLPVKSSKATSIEVIISNKLGLHARAAAQFVKIANRYKCEIMVQKEMIKVNGKSIMGILMLAAPIGTKLTISADGIDAIEAINSLRELVLSKFGEE